MSLFEKLYNIASKPSVYKSFVVLLVLEILFIIASSGGLFSEISNHLLFRGFLIFLLLILLLGIYTITVHSYLDQEKKAGTTASYKKFKKKFIGILFWLILIGFSTLLYTKFTIFNTQNARINKCISNYGLSTEKCSQFYKLGKIDVKKTQIESEGKETFIAGCLNNGKSSLSYCSCGFDKIVEKYTYYGYVNLQSDFAKSIYNGKSTNELKSFWQFIQNIPALCSIN